MVPRSAVRLFLTFVLGLATAGLASNPVQLENAKPGSAWDLQEDANGEIEGYASATSINRGESISIYVRTTQPTYSVSVFRMGWYGGMGARKMLGPIVRTAVSQPMPTPNATTGMVECNWSDPYVLTVPASSDPTDWMSGVYLARLTAGNTTKEKYVMFVVRDDARVSTHYFQSAVNTNQAYNNWGGKSLYGFNSTGPQAVKVSFNRPYNTGAGTGQFLWQWEYNMVRFLEREGYDVSYCTSLDTARRGSLLMNHKDFLSVGHDEYWSYEMRANVESALAGGVHLGFFSANDIYWQVRFEPSPLTGVADRTMTSYKESAGTKDPFATDSDPNNNKYVTTNWRSAPVNRPEAALIGVQYIYDPVDTDLVIDNVTSAPWVFANTGLHSGDHLLGLVGYEVDAMSANSPAGTVRLGHSPFTDTKGSMPVTRFSDMTVYTASSGATVFATGTIQWAWGLDDWNATYAYSGPLRVSAAAQQLTRNVLQRFAGNAAQGDCQYTVTPSSVQASAAGGRTTATVTGMPGCNWTTTSNVTWIVIESGATGSGSGSATFLVQANSGAARSGVVTVAGKSIAVQQDAASCTYAISPSSASVTSAAGSGSFALTSNFSSCPWSITSSAAWLTVSSAMSGSGSATISYSVAANSGGARSATLTVGGQTFTVSQSAAPCAYSIAPSSASAPSTASSGSFNLTANVSSCPWSVTSSAAWLTVTPPTSGNGSATIAYNVAANSGEIRSATLTVAGQTFTVTQSAAPCTYALSPVSRSVTAAATSGTVSLTANLASCSWSIGSSASWLTVSSAMSGSGSATISYNVAANSGEIRTATLTVGGQTFTVTQDAAPCVYSISPSSGAAPATPSSGSFALTANLASCPWSVTSSAPWLTVNSAATGNGSTTVSYSVAANSGEIRSATLTVAGRTFNLTQDAAACTYSLSPSSRSVTSAATAGTLALTSNLASCTWSITSSAAWLTVSSATSGSGNATISYNVAANSGEIRTATLTVGGRTFTVTQDAAPCTYSVSPASRTAPYTQSSGSFTLTANLASCPWSVTPSASWLSVTSPPAGTGSGSATISYSVAANNGDARSATLTVGGRTFTVNQDAVPCAYSISPSAASAPVAWSSGSFTLTTNLASCPWSTVSSASWLTVTSPKIGSGNGSTTVAYTAEANSGPPRSATITVAGLTFTVNQAGTCSYAVSPLSIAAGSPASTFTVTISADSACYWSAESFDSWLTITSPTQGSGNGTVTVAVAQNNARARVGSLSIAGSSVVVSQRACPTCQPGTDFDGNGKIDIVQRSNVTGESKVWLMNGTAFLGAADLPRPGSSWQLAGVGDFNADGFADQLFRNSIDYSMAIWYMNGTTHVTTATVQSVPDPAWTVNAIGDMNGDGYPDIVWRNSSTFGLIVWKMRDNVLQSVATLPSVPDANWQLKGLGDFNRDGKLDMVWRNEKAYNTAIWLMNDTAFVSGAQLPTVGSPWQLVGVGDFNSDGDADLIWHATTSPYPNAIWLMNQTSLSTVVNIPATNDPAWDIVAPR
jgi:hypothetical protein